MTQNLTLGETAASLHDSLAEYIEATYHITDQSLVDQRRQLLGAPGVIGQRPFIESTPRYRAGDEFARLGLPGAALEVLEKAASITREGAPLVHNPPYQHQAESLQRVLSDARSIVVTTGTGSGKTECFLLPILGHLAEQAGRGGAGCGDPALRAIILYPMNALVNDQLGRLRLLFGDPELGKWFSDRWGRPVRFARYTSRTLYPGVRTGKRDQQRLKPIRKYYIETERRASAGGQDGEASRHLLAELRRRGKWPAKPDLEAWYGADRSLWQDKAGNFLRCLTQPDDPELLTRHEVLAAPPDLLVTNYSMLEYMLMRPLERPVFDITRKWFAAHPNERFIVVVDEAHLYRGAAGAEVGLLLRRLRERLGISADRLQVICTTASFGNADAAPGFGAALTGKSIDDFDPVTGKLALRPRPAPGTVEQAEVLASVDMDKFYSSPEAAKADSIAPVLRMLGAKEEGDAATALYRGLSTYGPMDLLINETMLRAQPVHELATLLFPEAPAHVSERAATALVALGSYAREPGASDGPGLLPSRLHAFYRGLPGLWVCLDPDCDALSPASRGGVAGTLYSQPRLRCDCGARVFELFTCRHCGTAYGRAYTDDLEAPTFLWSQGGEATSTASGQATPMVPVDLLLSSPAPSAAVRTADLDLVTGRVDPRTLGPRSRTVYLPNSVDKDGTRTGEFKPCAVCDKYFRQSRTPVQDHQTKGDQPFQVLVARQVEIQQPSGAKTTFAPLAGRKVLVFSDSRQTAARLAPNLQKFTTRDAVRPLLLAGFQELLKDPFLAPFVSLDDSYLAVLMAMRQLGVRLRPTTRIGETFLEDVARVDEYLELGANAGPQQAMMVWQDVRSRSRTAPEFLTHAIHDVTHDQFTGLAALALATVEPLDASFVDGLPTLGPDITTTAQKRAVIRTWIDCWPGARLAATPTRWDEDELKPRTGKWTTRMKPVLGKAQAEFEKVWLPVLLAKLGQAVGKEYQLRGAALTLEIGGDWSYCRACRSTLRPIPGRESLCSYCGQHEAGPVDPEGDPVFRARKAFYRRASVETLRDGTAPIALIAAEHTAQLNEAQADAVFSEAEENELLFQDINLGEGKPAIDVLSCTTTMEVGIDIGSLSGVALRNMPPGRANYQQRSGRAGRRGRAIATVTAFANTQSHDEHGFREPQEFIRGPVMDPEMALDNWQIARRHLTAFVLQEYLSVRVPAVSGQGGAYGAQLFEVLGSVTAFLEPASPLNASDFRAWVGANAEGLAARAAQWLPEQLSAEVSFADLPEKIRETADIVDAAVGDIAPDGKSGSSAPDTEVEPAPELDSDAAAPGGPGASPETLLGRLLYRGALPRYAFPTDVGIFHVFDKQESKPYRPAFQYTPSQGMPVALTQYAPGRRVWIGGKEWVSGAIYSRMLDDRFDAWQARRLYLECGNCHYAKLEDFDGELRGQAIDCPACGETGALGPAQLWFRPPGFAHPVGLPENTSPDDDVAPSYATRAKLTAAGPVEGAEWLTVTDHISLNFGRRQLLVTNRGPETEGYTYCTRCGLIEPAAVPEAAIVPGHKKPYPDDRDPICPGDLVARSVVLGTDFITDVLLIGLRVDRPLTLKPEYESTKVALRTISEALTAQAAVMLGIGSSEIQAEFRPALTAGGPAGLAAEIYMYDTLAGGAGFVQRAGRLGRALFEKTLERLEHCPSNCDAACYSCLQGFKNQFEHASLDRHLGASLLRYLLSGALPSMNASRVQSSVDVLVEDLLSLGVDGLTLERSAEVDVPGIGVLRAPIVVKRRDGRNVVVVLHHPCSPNVLLAPEWTEPSETGVDPLVYPVDELLVRRNLPRASSNLLQTLGFSQ